MCLCVGDVLVENGYRLGLAPARRIPKPQVGWVALLLSAPRVATRADTTVPPRRGARRAPPRHEVEAACRACQVQVSFNGVCPSFRGSSPGAPRLAELAAAAPGRLAAWLAPPRRLRPDNKSSG
ncbi:hypothetical protein EYF80_050684 [Liparis tanakae]|uniref:Uncharacterized protein n=1 Tax=Liparis tanakae TaxID=230148 RepID=A0A4Z2FE50_9TELE|nr:hypothetical protein EYF80_050684 [Liparis tanakae]